MLARPPGVWGIAHERRGEHVSAITQDETRFLEQPITRRSLLKGAGAAGLGATLGYGLLAERALGQTAPLDPRDLNFEVLAQYRPFRIVSEVEQQLDETFDTAGLQGYSLLRPAPEGRRGRAQVAGGSLTVTDEQAYSSLFVTQSAPVAPYAAVEVDVRSLSGAPGDQDTVSAGLVRDADNWVLASFNGATGTVAVEVSVDGRVSTLNEATVTGVAAPMRFAFVLNENLVTALVDTGTAEDEPYEGWRPLLRSNVAAELDLRDPEVLPRHRFAFGVRATSGTITLDGVRAGYWGEAGVRDPHVVTFADGTPYIVDDKLYLTLTNAGLGFFQAAHWGVYTLDLTDLDSPDALQEVGKVFFQRGGRLVGDHAGHIVYDGRIDAFRVLASTWGTFSGNGVRITSSTFSGPLSGVRVIREPELLRVPTRFSRWDPHLTRISGRWYVAYVESPTQTPFRFYPALARGTTLQNLTSVGRDTSRTETEGMVIQRFGGRWYVLCSSSEREGTSASGEYRIYDLRMNFVGFLNAPHPTNIPHPMVQPVPIVQDGRTRYLLVTFNGTQFFEDVLGYGTHGDFFVMEADETFAGFEFRPREAPTR
jgi:hypothetical protein